MLYSKRRKNLGGGAKKRSNRKSFMSGGAGAGASGHSPLDVNLLCNLIYENTPIWSRLYKPFFNFTRGEWPHYESFEVNELQKTCINGVSSRGFSPLSTACKNHSSIELIKYFLGTVQFVLVLHKSIKRGSESIFFEFI